MDAMHIGDVIAGRRRELGLTQRELAARIGVSDKAVSKWETGRGLPDAAMIPAVAAELGVSVDELFGGDGSEEAVPQSATEDRPTRSLGQLIRMVALRVLRFLAPLLCAVVLWPLLAHTPLNVARMLFGTQYPWLFLLVVVASAYTLCAAWGFYSAKAQSRLARLTHMCLGVLVALVMDALPLAVMHLPVRTGAALALNATVYVAWAVLAAVLFARCVARRAAGEK